MIPDDVHMDEMPTSDDHWPTADPVLAAFAEDLRTIAGGPVPEPRPGLVAAMRQGASLPIEPLPGRRKMLVRTLVGTLTEPVRELHRIDGVE